MGEDYIGHGQGTKGFDLQGQKCWGYFFVFTGCFEVKGDSVKRIERTATPSARRGRPSTGRPAGNPSRSRQPPIFKEWRAVSPFKGPEPPPPHVLARGERCGRPGPAADPAGGPCPRR